MVSFENSLPKIEATTLRKACDSPNHNTIKRTGRKYKMYHVAGDQSCLMCLECARITVAQSRREFVIMYAIRNNWNINDVGKNTWIPLIKERFNVGRIVAWRIMKDAQIHYATRSNQFNLG